MSDLFVDDRVKEGFNYLIKWVAYSPRSEKECINRLFEKQYHKDEIEQIIEIAKNDSIINDDLYVDIFINSYKLKYGRKRIEDKLIFEKGIVKDLVRSKLDYELSEEFENNLALEIAKKYIFQKHIKIQEQSDKLIGYLLNKGFSWPNINFVKKNISFDFEYDGE